MRTEAHEFTLRVYFEDTDTGGIVYYANYLRFAERGRTEMLRELGFESSAMMADTGAALAVRRATADYLKPARLDDLLTVKTRVLAVKGARLSLSQVVCREGETLVEMEIELACMAADGRPRRLPAALRDAFRASLV